MNPYMMRYDIRRPYYGYGRSPFFFGGPFIGGLFGGLVGSAVFNYSRPRPYYPPYPYYGGGSPYGGSPYGGSPYGGSPYGGSPYGGSPYGGSPYGGSPYGGSPYGGFPYGGGYPPK
ncbi:hypothetical protein ACFFIX_26605 [Metabacillus herbersteinensis]|uniref:Spore coat protein n=1 Tax=Metabacillus herbersteinensis TaxID=283816 RepID=A0ABV6GNA7_9BACI